MVSIHICKRCKNIWKEITHRDSYKTELVELNHKQLKELAQKKVDQGKTLKVIYTKYCWKCTTDKDEFTIRSHIPDNLRW